MTRKYSASANAEIYVLFDTMKSYQKRKRNFKHFSRLFLTKDDKIYPLILKRQLKMKNSLFIVFLKSHCNF